MLSWIAPLLPGAPSWALARYENDCKSVTEDKRVLNHMLIILGYDKRDGMDDLDKKKEK
mgnify:CR=1 FL=1